MNPTNSKTWCVNAFYGLQASNAGETRACCMYRRQEEVPELKLGIDRLEKHFNYKELIQLRTDAASGIRNPGCQRCWEEEDGGISSKRVRDNKKYLRRLWQGLDEYEGLSFLELNLGNTCNLRCRTCGPHASSQWAKESYDVYYKNTLSQKNFTKFIQQFNNSFDDESPFWQDLEDNLSTIRQLDFYGGEPFMAKKMWRVLKVAIEKGYAKDIELHYATNGSFWPDEVEYFQFFKSVSISFSIDGTGEQFEFLRYLAEWDIVKENMEKARAYRTLHPSVRLGWCVTLSNMNIFNLPELFDKYYEAYSDFGCYLNLVHGPRPFNISIMPDHVKNLVLDKLNAVPKEYDHIWTQLPGIIGFIENGTYEAEHWNKFLDKLCVHDQYRTQDYAKIFPEFAKIIGYSNDRILEHTGIKADTY
jgi:sulfatase maturation enzyme AslB (radical SAM superfamily)